MNCSNKNPQIIIKPEEIHLWIIDQDRLSKYKDEWKEIIGLDERDQAERFKFEKDREKFISGRGILRRLLSGYLNLSAFNINYKSNPYGKLYLPSHPLKFNISNCQNRVICGFVLNQEIGVDIEKVCPIDNLQRLANASLSKKENQEMLSMLPAEQLEYFYYKWTQKEAFYKAKGAGINTMGLNIPIQEKLEGNPDFLTIHDNDDYDWTLFSYKLEPDWWISLCYHSGNYYEIVKFDDLRLNSFLEKNYLSELED